MHKGSQRILTPFSASCLPASQPFSTLLFAPRRPPLSHHPHLQILPLQSPMMFDLRETSSDVTHSIVPTSCHVTQYYIAAIPLGHSSAGRCTTARLRVRSSPNGLPLGMSFLSSRRVPVSISPGHSACILSSFLARLHGQTPSLSPRRKVQRNQNAF